MLRLKRSIALCLALAVFHTSAAELSIGVSSDITSMDPHFVNLFANLNAGLHVFEPLVTLDPDSRLIPGLATAWKSIDPRIGISNAPFRQPSIYR
jgi:peptide/nickel transport system substrate-binding protein